MAVNPFKNQKGFILAAVLWVLAIMLIAVGVFHAYVQRKLSVGLQAKAHIQQQLDSQSTEQTVLYLLSTSRITLAGLTFTKLTTDQQLDENFSFTSAVGDELWMDSTIYQGLGSTQFSVQDNAGLIALNAPDTSVLSNFMDHFERDPSNKTRLLSALQDYIDADDLISLSGAEKLNYAANNMSPPTNDFLRTVPELVHVMGWREWLIEHPEVDVQNWMSVGRFTIMNLNTMPKSLLMRYLGLNEQLTDQLIVERKTNPFRSTEDFILRTNLILNLDEDRYRFLPGNEIRLKIWNKGGGQARLISLQLTPNGLFGPWLVDYEYSVQSVESNNEAMALRQSNLFNSALGDDPPKH
jgi:general secretion pathway protein K